MEIITSNKSLAEAIKALEAKKNAEKNLLFAHFEFTKEQLNPVTIVKQKFNETIHSGEIKDKILTAAMGIASGFATKKLLLGKSSNPIVGLILSAVQTKLIASAKDSNIVQEKGIPLAINFLKKIKIE